MEINDSMLATVPVSTLEAVPSQDTPSVSDKLNKTSSGIEKVVISQRKYKVGYIVKNEAWRLAGDTVTEPCFIKAAYNLKGEYIGDPKRARLLIVKMGIKPTKASKKHCVCSIGYCKRQRKWYGWSHRAMVGFGIGDRLFEENYREHISEEKRDMIPFLKHGSVIIRNLKQAKQAAINFATSVS